MISVPDIPGDPLRSGILRGRVVLLLLWAEVNEFYEVESIFQVV